MKGCIFTGKYSNETIDRFENLIDGNDRVLKIPEEMDLKTFYKGVYSGEKEIEDIISKYRFISFGNMELNFEIISRTLRFMKPIFINATTIKSIKNCTKDELLQFFDIIECNENNLYPLEYLYRALANNNYNKFYIYSKNDTQLEDLTDKLSNMKEIFTLDIEYKNILKVLKMINLSNIVNFSDKENSTINEICFEKTVENEKLDISYILLDNPLIKNQKENRNEKTTYRHLTSEEFSNVVDALDFSNYPYIVCESLDRINGNSNCNLSKSNKIFNFSNSDINNFDVCIRLVNPYLIEIK